MGFFFLVFLILTDDTEGGIVFFVIVMTREPVFSHHLMSLKGLFISGCDTSHHFIVLSVCFVVVRTIDRET